MSTGSGHTRQKAVLLDLDGTLVTSSPLQVTGLPASRDAQWRISTGLNSAQSVRTSNVSPALSALRDKPDLTRMYLNVLSGVFTRGDGCMSNLGETGCLALQSGEEVIGSGHTRQKAVLFDLDNTLIDSLCVYHSSVNHILSLFGAGCTIDELMEHAGASGEELYTYFLKREGKYDHSIKKGLKREFDTKFLELLQDVEFPKKSSDVLIELKKKGYVLALCTGASRSHVQAMLPENTSSLFSSIVTCDDVSACKPDPETFLKASDDIGVPPTNCTVVGDGTNDLIGAKSAGMAFIMVRSLITAALIPVLENRLVK